MAEFVPGQAFVPAAAATVRTEHCCCDDIDAGALLQLYARPALLFSLLSASLAAPLFGWRGHSLLHAARL
jgi:hypothetical protein